MEGRRRATTPMAAILTLLVAAPGWGSKGGDAAAKGLDVLGDLLLRDLLLIEVYEAWNVLVSAANNMCQDHTDVTLVLSVEGKQVSLLGVGAAIVLLELLDVLLLLP